MAARDPLTHALLVKTPKGAAIKNPLFLAVRQSANDMLRCAGEFGLTPVAWARVAAGPFTPPPGPSKFDGLIG
jgi:phage terminase small subunit